MVKLAVFTIIGMTFCGCHRGGLSPREQGNTNYTVYLMSLYDNANAGAAPVQAQGLRLPARLAVAQIGEVAPPQGRRGSVSRWWSSCNATPLVEERRP